MFLRYLSWFGYANENLLINQFHKIDDIPCDDLNVECIRMFENGI